ncbi:MAG: hypothetical protein RLZZ324_505, partial [Candidatus Parcubacteria bacterium]
MAPAPRTKRYAWTFSNGFFASVMLF